MHALRYDNPCQVFRHLRNHSYRMAISYLHALHACFTDKCIYRFSGVPIALTPHGRPYGYKPVRDRFHMPSTTSRRHIFRPFDVLSLSYSIGCDKEIDAAILSNDNAHHPFPPPLIFFAPFDLPVAPIDQYIGLQQFTSLRICRQVILQNRATSSMLIRVIVDRFLNDC